MSTCVIGVDPGATSGLCIYDGVRAELLQATPGAVVPVIASLIGDLSPYQPRLIAVERFVVGTRASRSASAKAGQTTRELIGALIDLGARLGVGVLLRSASEVKPWATDERLDAAGLFAKGMRHANDAARHALYAAVKDAGLPDPLSRSHRSPRRTP